MIAGIDILKQLLDENGYSIRAISPAKVWSRILAFDSSIINKRLEFVLAINHQGDIWVSKTPLSKEFLRDFGFKIITNINDPSSIEVIESILAKLKAEHNAAHQNSEK